MKRLFFILLLLASIMLFAEWTIVQTFSIPGKASGLAWDGTNLYSGIYGVNGSDVYQIDPVTGNYQLLFAGPQNDSFGMTHDGTNIWITDHVTSSSVPATAIKFDNSGNILTQFDLPDHYMSGITYDEGNFWVSTYYPDDPSIVYQVDNSGSILSQINFDLPGNNDEQPWDLCIENGNLWIADYNDNSLHKVDPANGTILESNDCENIKPAGITFDGNYLWYVDGALNSNSTLYKVDLGGAGTPVISLGWEEYDFGNTLVGGIEMVDLPITNTGTADLQINEMNFSQAEFFIDQTLPITITPNSTEDVTINFMPTAIGQYEAILTIVSNDPVNPNEEAELAGYGVLEDPHIMVNSTLIDYGSIRINATTGRYINISNQGEGLLAISEFEFETADYFVDDTTEFPIEIATNSSVDIRIWFNPQSSGNLDSYFTIHCNDPITPMLDITLEGTGENIILGIGSLIWQHQITTGYDNSPKAISRIADVTGDGKNDVIITSEDNFVRCFNGNSSWDGDIIWETEIYSGNIFGQNGLIIVNDINNDDYEDVVVGTGGGDRAVRAISGKTGEILFTYFTDQYGEGGVVYQVESSHDFNADGINDILAATGDDSYGTGPERVFLLDGTDGSVIWNFHTSGPKFACIAVNDVNNDGVPDVIGGASNSSETTGLVYGIDGASGAQLWEFSATGSSVWAVETIDDVNNDGIDDIVAGDFSGNVYAFDATNGSTLWTASAGTCIILRFEKIDDVNSDGHPDIAVAHSSNHNAIVIDGFTGSTIWLHPVADQPWCIDRIEDISGDGINDLIVGTLYSNNYGYFLDGTDGTELGSVNVGSAVDAIGGIIDVTGDGSWEMVVGGRDGTVICISGGQVEVQQGTLQGFITLNGGTSTPEDCEIEVNGNIIIPDENGFFEIILAVGIYDLTVSCSGYLPMIVNNIPVMFAQVTVINITLDFLFPPQNLDYTISEQDVILSWEEPELPADLYKIYRDEEELAEVTELTYTDGNLPAGSYEYYVTALYYEYESEPSNIIEIEMTSTDEIMVPLVTKLDGNYPNPFNPITNIKFSLHRDDFVTLIIYNVKGEKVRGLIKENLLADYHNIIWNGEDDNGITVASGIYFYRFSTKEYTETKKCLMLK